MFSIHTVNRSIPIGYTKRKKKFVSVYKCLVILFTVSTDMELYRSLSIGQKKELIVGLTNRETGEHCSSMFLFSSSFFFFSLIFSWRVKRIKQRKRKRGNEENPVVTRHSRPDVRMYACVRWTRAYWLRERERRKDGW